MALFVCLGTATLFSSFDSEFYTLLDPTVGIVMKEKKLGYQAQLVRFDKVFKT